METDMDLADFIEANLEALIDDWAEYAMVLNQGKHRLTAVELRNSGAELLTRVAANMRQAQTPLQQRQKSHGAKREQDSAFDTVSMLHADDRLSQGFGINEVLAEYRALRASVLRRWEHSALAGPQAFQEMIRFNEAIDQGLTESVRQFSERTERIRDLFAGVLAHDLRSPLGVLLNSAEILSRDRNLSPASIRATSYVQRSAVRMKWMIDDLLVFARTRLGSVLPVALSEQDLARICRHAAEEIGALYPEAVIRVECPENLIVRCDPGRIGQLLFNLLSNAARYGAGEIELTAMAEPAGWVWLEVANEGPPIPRRALPTLFDPLTRASSATGRTGMAAGIGLGLYICRCIATAHQGVIDVRSGEDRTVFTLRMPVAPQAS
ncbi:sensor histidine kinase [Achromobacter xylosoxidans]|uniref:sensor histidine kinase n=2 Tax=Alcaligenes xylosoxydans xylosoxydans TaxID=85698 RepID=UPI0030C6B658